MRRFQSPRTDSYQARCSDTTQRSVRSGTVLLVIGRCWLVVGTVTVTRAFEVSASIIGLPVAAIGTSLPKFATSVVNCVRGERDTAVGNAVGSSLFNILAILGVTAVASPSGMPVSRAALGLGISILKRNKIMTDSRLLRERIILLYRHSRPMIKGR